MNVIKHFKTLVIVSTALLVLAGCSTLGFVNNRAVTIDEVISMSKAGVDKDVIIQHLKSTHTRFKLTPDDITRLTKEGVNNDVIKAMVRSEKTTGPYPWEYGLSPWDEWYYSDYPWYHYYPYYSPYWLYYSPYWSYYGYDYRGYYEGHGYNEEQRENQEGGGTQKHRDTNDHGFSQKRRDKK